MADTVTVTMPVKLTCWPIPEQAYVEGEPGKRQDGMKPSPSIPLTSLASVAMDELAQTWLNQLYASVGRRPPFYRNAEPAPPEPR